MPAAFGKELSQLREALTTDLRLKLNFFILMSMLCVHKLRTGEEWAKGHGSGVCFQESWAGE